MTITETAVPSVVEKPAPEYGGASYGTLRIRVNDGNDRVNVRIPLLLVVWCLRVVERLTGVQLPPLFDVLRRESEGKLVEITDGSRSRVEISVE